MGSQAGQVGEAEVAGNAFLQAIGDEERGYRKEGGVGGEDGVLIN